MKTFLMALLLAISATTGFSAEGLLPQRVLYVGHRGPVYERFLQAHFAKVKAVSLDDFKPAQANDFDVVVLDWPQGAGPLGSWRGHCPLGIREEWNKPTVLLGSAGLNLAVAWKLKGGSGCTCLAPVAYNLRDHLIFKSPIPVNIHATTNIPTPVTFRAELTNATTPVFPLVDGIVQYQTVIHDFAPGWSSHYYEFADMPEVEVFCGGINEQTPRSAAFWRQANLLHFGFEQSPAEMNDSGRAMLVNSVVYISEFTEDRPIDITPSVFAGKIARTRERAKNYFTRFQDEVPSVYSAETLGSFNWHDAAAAKEWFATARPWLHPNAANLLEIDSEAKSLGVPFDSQEFLPKTIAALREKSTAASAAVLLARYVFQPLDSNAGPDEWEQWWTKNSPYLFYSELGGYRWYIDPLAKQRGIPTRDLRGSLRADFPKH